MSPAETERLVGQLQGPDADARVQAAIRLSERGPSACPVMPDLIRALGHADPAVRKVVVWVLGYAGAGVPAAEAALDRARNDADPAVRRAARAAMTVTGLGRAA